MNIRWTIMVGVMGILMHGQAQNKPADSVIIRVGEGSKVIFAIQDKADLETLKHYDFQALMSDMITKLEKKDTSQLATPSQAYRKDTVQNTVAETVSSTDHQEDWDHGRRKRDHWHRGPYQSWNFDIGTNNYLSNGKFPDQNNELYTVKPWGSWYVAINSIQKTYVKGKFFLEWGGGVSWYNFKYQNDKVVMTKDNNGVTFSEDARDYNFLKSKLTATYVNLSLVPVIDFSGNHRKSGLFEGHHGGSFRFGLGPYAGYRIDSYAKQTYESEGDKHKEHNKDNYYLNNMRYGLRLQLGFRDVDLFMNYDLNHLYTAGKGPQLNAFSFGVTF